MNLLSNFGSAGSAPGTEQAQALEYDAIVSSPAVNGEAKLTIGENSLTIAALFGAFELTYAEVTALELADYAVLVRADDGVYTFSRMGRWARPFYDALYDAYNKAVLRSLFVSGKPVITAQGRYGYTEGGEAVSGGAPIHVYENSVVILPPDLSARRVPLCFTSGMDKSDYALTLRLDTGESYTLSKLGYDTEPFADAVVKEIRKLREKSLAAVKALDPSLTSAQASHLAGLMPEGAAAPIGRLAAIAPSFVAAIEAKISETRASNSYIAFKELCDPAQIWVGIMKNSAPAAGAKVGIAGGLDGVTGGSPHSALTGTECSGSNPASMLSGLINGTGGELADVPDPYRIWLIAPSPDGQHAAVEFSEADTATFVYRTGGDFDRFAKLLNRALEAIAFKREVIRLTDEELRKPENADYYMSSMRTAALSFVRASFAGRVIHGGAESWKKKLSELWSAG